MKIKIINDPSRNYGQVQITSESVAEANALLTVIGTRKHNRWDTVGIDTLGSTKVQTAANVSHRKHKRHNFTKVCEVCGKGYKGLQGLGAHKRKIHGIISPATLKKQANARANNPTPTESTGVVF